MPIVSKKERETAPVGQAVSLAEAKANFSSLVNRVQAKRKPITILRRGVPVAQITPIANMQTNLYGSMQGTVKEIGDIIGPTGVEWTAGDE